MYIYGKLQKGMLHSRLPCLQGHVGGGNRQELECVCEKSNAVNWYAVAVLKDNTIVGHLLKTSARIYSFLRRGVVIWYRVAGSRKYSDLPQGKFFSQDKISPPQVLGKNFPAAKISHYTVHIYK